MSFLELKKKVMENKGLNDFIEFEKSYFLSLNTGINWEDERWNVENWLFHRGKDKYLVFKANFRIGNKLPFGTVLPETGPLLCKPSPDWSIVVQVYPRLAGSCVKPFPDWSVAVQARWLCRSPSDWLVAVQVVLRSVGSCTGLPPILLVVVLVSLRFICSYTGPHPIGRHLYNSPPDWSAQI